MSEHENIRRFLLENADAPVRYTLTKDPSLIEGILKNSEAASWLERLKQRSAAEDLSSIHGSHDYRIENILGKLWILGFDRNIPEFDASLQYILYFLRRHVKSPERGGGFGAIYSSLDYELLLAAYMPFFGYWDDEAVMHIALKRIGLLFDFFDKGNHDIYINPAGLKSVPKAWKEYILNPELYAGGNVKLPFIHDIILFAGMYNHTDTGCRHKIDAVIEWMCGESYRLMWKNKAVFYTEGGQYTSKAISVGAFPPDTDNTDGSFLFSAFLWSRLPAFRQTDRYDRITGCLNAYRDASGLYKFPPDFIKEKKDTYLTSGGHMNPGENKKAPEYSRLISTYWMYRILTGI